RLVRRPFLFRPTSDRAVPPDHRQAPSATGGPVSSGGATPWRNPRVPSTWGFQSEEYPHWCGPISSPRLRSGMVRRSGLRYLLHVDAPFSESAPSRRRGGFAATDSDFPAGVHSGCRPDNTRGSRAASATDAAAGPRGRQVSRRVLGGAAESLRARLRLCTPA